MDTDALTGLPVDTDIDADDEPGDETETTLLAGHIDEAATAPFARAERRPHIAPVERRSVVA